MKALLAGLAAAGLTASLVAAPIEARAGDGGAVAAGIIGGLAAGALIGSAARPPAVVYAPAPVYAVPPPPPPTCYWAPGAAVWDPYRAAWVRPQVQVCN
jgi:hypothetical protein